MLGFQFTPFDAFCIATNKSCISTFTISKLKKHLYCSELNLVRLCQVLHLYQEKTLINPKTPFLVRAIIAHTDKSKAKPLLELEAFVQLLALPLLLQLQKLVELPNVGPHTVLGNI